MIDRVSWMRSLSVGAWLCLVMVAACNAPTHTAVTEVARPIAGALVPMQTQHSGLLVSEVHCLDGSPRASSLGAMLQDINNFAVVRQREATSYLLRPRAAPIDMTVQGSLRWARADGAIVAVFVNMMGPGDSRGCGRIFHAGGTTLEVAPLRRETSSLTNLPTPVREAFETMAAACALPPAVLDINLCQMTRLQPNGWADDSAGYYKFTADGGSFGFLIRSGPQAWKVYTVGSRYWIYPEA